MPRPIIVRIDVDDKGNPRIAKLAQNAKKVKEQVLPLGDVMKAAFASTIVIRGIAMMNMKLRESVKSAAEFELSIKRISAITDTYGADLDAISNKAREMAVGTEHSATAISKAMLDLSKMGLSTTQTLEAVPSVLDLATVSGTELGGTAKDLASIMKAFKIPFEETAHVANVVATTVNKTALDWDDYREAMKFVASVSDGLNVSLEETSALMGVIGDVGIRGSLGGNALKNMFLNILKPSEAVANELKNMNMEGMSFADILKTMRERGLNVKDFLETFNKRAVTSSLAVAGLADKVNELEEALINPTKTIKEQAEEIRDTALIQWQRMGNVINEIGLSIAEAFGKRPQSVVEGIIDVLQDVNHWVDANHESIQELADVFISFGSDLKSVFEGLAPSIKLAAEHLDLFVSVAKVLMTIAIANKFSKIATAIQGAGGLTGAVGGLQTAFMSLNPVMLAVVAAGAAVIGILNHMGKKVREQTDNIKSAFDTKEGMQEHLKELEQMRDLMKKIEKDSEMMAKNNPFLVASKKGLENLQKIYKEKYGKTSIEFVDTLKEIELQIKGTQALLDKFEESKDKVTKDKNVTRYNPTGSSVGGGGGSGTGTVKTDLDILKEAVEEFERLENLKKKSAEDWQAWGNKENQALEEWLKRQQDKEKALQEIVDTHYEFWKDTAQSTTDSIMEITNNIFSIQEEKLQQHFDKRTEMLENWHNLEVAKAGESAFLKQMAEEKYQQEKLSLEAEYERKRKEIAKRQKAMAIAEIAVNTARGIMDAVATAPTVAGKIIAASIIGSIGAAQTAVAMAQPLRTGGIVPGLGGPTSDSNLFRLSPGERVLTRNDIGLLGGNDKIQQMIDRGNSYTENRNVSVYIDTVIGTNEYVRYNVIPAVKKELAR